MYDALNTPGCPKKERGILDPNINDDTLDIGSLTQVDNFTWEVSRRPLSMNMNELVRLGGLPRSKLPTPYLVQLLVILKPLRSLTLNT
ncbi:hypothetical protein N7491_002666 [Penicillium cf. griseofulvum]|nr:hypothetical protein N7491_002666 [Penicillium cf. griseofulvum]